MKAAVVSRFGEAPRYADAPEPVATGPEEVVVEVVASALSPRTRSQAAGTHYAGTGALPLIPGIDGVGRTPEGRLRYFLLPDTNRGALAERVAVDLRRSVPLPEGADPILVAALMNPAMASWVALRRRVRFRSGHGVLILGATGNAGRLAVQVAARLGAGRIVAVGRRAERMRDLGGIGVTRIVELAAEPGVVARELAESGADVDVVLDFLWGEPTRAALRAIIPNRTRDEQLLTWVQLGSVAGLESPIPAAALRAVNLRLIGSGQGSVPPDDYRREVAALASEVARGAFRMSTRQVPLSAIETAWPDTGSADRTVIVP